MNITRHHHFIRSDADDMSKGTKNLLSFQKPRILAIVSLVTVLLFSPIFMDCTLAQSKGRPTQTVRKKQQLQKRRATTNNKKEGTGNHSYKQQEEVKENTPPPPPTPHIFQGSLLYRNYEYHSAMIRKFSYGNAYNGDRTMVVTLKGNSIHFEDQNMHLHTILLLDEQRAYLYSDITKTGVEGDIDFINTYLSGMDPNVKTGKFTKTFTIKSKGQSIQYMNQDCIIFRGQLNTGGNATTDVEMWVSKLMLANPAYKYLFGGLPTGEGIVIKGIYSFDGTIPILGKMKSTVATELIGYKERKVQDSEMRPPSDIHIERMTQNSQLTKFYKANTKELKKLKIYPESKNKKEAKYSITSRWDFADEWLEKKSDINYFAASWDLLKPIVNKVGEIIENHANSNENEVSSVEDSGGEGEDMLSVRGLIAKLENENNSFQNEIKKAKKKAKARANARNSNRAVPEYSSRKEKILSWMDGKSSSEEWNTRIQWLQNKLRLGQEYISREEWNSYLKGRGALFDADMDAMRRRREASHKRTQSTINSMKNSNYNTLERNLEMMHDLGYPYNNGYNIEEVRRYQEKMKELRGNGGKKSKWEDWDGVAGSMK